MTPTHKSERCELYLADCATVLPTLTGVDCVITDPPYGLQDRNMRNSSAYMDMSWDVRVDDETIAKVIKAADKAIIFGGNYYSLPPCRGFIVWDKGESMYGRGWAECEMAWTNFDVVARIYKLHPNNPDGKVHPAQKPLELMEWIVQNYTAAADTILDPFCGSGTTGVAAMKLGRRFIGIEKDERYYRISEKRIRDAESQPALLQV